MTLILTVFAVLPSTINTTPTSPRPRRFGDTLSQVKTVQTPDTAVVTTDYSGAAVTVTDQAGKQRRSLTDAQGRLIRVDEPNGCNNCLGSVSAPTQPTSYVYDSLDNLRRTQQGSQNRYFMYDSLSRLIRAKNPEQNANGNIALTDPVTGTSQWSMAYSYDPNGNLLTRVDARDVTTTYGYDNLNRNTAVSYSDGVTPGVNRYYDGAISNGKGRLHYSINYNSHPISGYAYSITQINGYDAMGRVSSQQQGFLNSAGTQWYYYPVSRTYNLAGNVLTQTYPSNRTTTYGYNAAAQLTSFIGTLGDGASRNYATGVTYTPAGLMSRETFGMQAATLYHNLHYNNRQQLVDIRVGDSSTDEWNWSRGALIYYYGTTARDSWNAFANSADNNGNVLRQVNYVPLSGGGYVIPQLDDYGYDALNRNTSVTEAQQNSSGSWTFNLFTQNFGYDRWGNRTVSCSPCQPGVTNDTFTIDTATNRITARNGMGMTYDAAGNQTYDTVGNRWFDGESRMYKAVQGGTTSHYVYDADGKRARRIIGSTETWMVYGIDGELIAEYAANGSAGSPQKEYGYRGGQMLIVAQTSPLEIRWTVTDHLGTPRMNIRGTGADGGSLGSVTRHDYLPFGEELFAGVGLRSSSSHGYEPPADGVRQKFGYAYERDSETGLDFAQARYFSSVQGRFTIPDPLQESAKLEVPQSWNRYAFVLNNPLFYVDPTGELWIASGDANNPYRWVDQCPEGGTCYEAVAAAVATGVTIYGSRDANDITPYNSNANGVVNATDIANHRDARYESVADTQPHPENFLSPTVAAALFNAARIYADAYPNDAEIVFTAGSAATGNPALNAQGEPVHRSHQRGQNIDMRYMGTNGRSLVGNTASANADVARMTTLFDAFDRQNAGLGAALTGTPERFGLGPIPAALANIHRNHIHLQRNYPRPPQPAQPARRR